jgi:hypothetical protein
VLISPEGRVAAAENSIHEIEESIMSLVAVSGREGGS